MRKIEANDSKVVLSTSIDKAINGEGTIITRHGKPQAVLLGYKDWLRLSKIPSFASLLMAVPDAIDDVPARP